MMPVAKRIFALLDKQGKSQQALADYIGKSKQTVNGWQKDENTSYTKYINQIAEFFGVTTDYLLTGTQPPIINENDAIKALVKTYSTEELLKISALPRDKAQKVVELVQALLEE